VSSRRLQQSIHRRDVFCGGGLTIFGTMLTTVLRGAKPARAASMMGAAPEVDSVAVRVVVDRYQFAVAPNMKIGNVEVQRFGWGIGRGKPPGQT
jgi:7,8-dihydropterin-6-yl-methyl-4-(beta-D-ribofuranosyl)aminobenzene 5'-phosphate synthase